MGEKKRVTFAKVMIVGPSGKGKSFGAKTLLNRPGKVTGYINADRQPLPFKGDFKYHAQPKTWAGFMKALEDFSKNPEITDIFIDSQSMGFEKLHEEMSTAFKGFDIYANYNKNVGRYLDLLRNIEKDIIVISHDETIINEGYRQKRAKVSGKYYEGRIEAYYTIVLFADSRVKDNKPEYFLKGFDTDASAKVPEGMFEGKLEIPNDGAYILDQVEEYYSA